MGELIVIPLRTKIAVRVMNLMVYIGIVMTNNIKKVSPSSHQKSFILSHINDISPDLLSLIMIKCQV